MVTIGLRWPPERRPITRTNTSTATVAITKLPCAFNRARVNAKVPTSSANNAPSAISPVRRFLPAGFVSVLTLVVATVTFGFAAAAGFVLLADFAAFAFAIGFPSLMSLWAKVYHNKHELWHNSLVT